MLPNISHIAKYSEVKRQTMDRHNVLLKKNVLNEISKEGAFTQDFKDWRKNNRKVSQNLDDLQTLLIKLTVKVSSEKAWLLYEFSFTLNSDGKRNDAHT